VGSACLFWLAVIVAYAVLIVLDKPFVDKNAWTEPLVIDGAFLLGSALLLARDQISWKAAGVCLPLRPISWPLNIAFVIGVQLVSTAVLFFLKGPDTFLSSFTLVEKFLWLCVSAPISEEVFVRGWFQTAYTRATGTAKGTSPVIVSAVFFAGMHLLSSASLLRNVLTVFGAFLSGLVFAKVRRASGSLMPAIVMHSACNASGFLMAGPLWHLISKTRG
jgi:membrane protease YdiL (CAAX protease family)